jgi:hypothetical protein
VAERTEDDGESGVLRIEMGGRAYRLPVLTIAQSEEWQENLAHIMAGVPVDMDDDQTGEVALRAVLTEGPKAMFKALATYDVNEVLGGEANIKSKMTQRELKDAVDLITEAEFPFDEGGRSVAEAFGLSLRVLGAATRMATSAGPRRVRSASGLSPTGVSPMPTSDSGGRPSNSSSAGPMDIDALVGSGSSG